MKSIFLQKKGIRQTFGGMAPNLPVKGIEGISVRLGRGL